MSKERASLGRAGEAIAAAYLAERGHRIVIRNYRGMTGEIDIITRDAETIVFVEVKTRRTNRFGGPAEAVTEAKQRQIAAAALEYLTRHHLAEAPTRFDVVAVTLGPAEPDIEHIVAAFEAG